MKKVLIIEDEEAIRIVLTAVSQRVGMEVTACKDLACGHHHFNLDYDLLVVDVSLPDGSGLDFIESARRDGYRGKVFVMTGHSDIDCSSLDVDQVLLKPFSMTKFLELVSS